MSEFVDFLQKTIKTALDEVDIGLIGKIDSFDKATMTASVTPLMKREDKVNGKTYPYASLKNVPCLTQTAGEFYIRPEYKSGDLVWLSFSTHSIEKGVFGQMDTATDSTFSTGNCVVVGLLPKQLSVPPMEYLIENGLIIGHKDGNSYMVFEKDKITMKFLKGLTSIEFSDKGLAITIGPSTFEFKVDGAKISIPGTEVSLDSLGVTSKVGPSSANLNTHMHPTGVGPSGSPIPGT